MKFLTKHRIIEIDLYDISMEEIYKKIKETRQPKSIENESQVKFVNEDCLMFVVQGNKGAPEMTHKFEYFKDKKEISVTSKFTSFLFPGFLFYLSLIHI